MAVVQCKHAQVSKVVLIPGAAIQIAIFEAQLWKIMIQSQDVRIKC